MSPLLSSTRPSARRRGGTRCDSTKQQRKPPSVTARGVLRSQGVDGGRAGVGTWQTVVATRRGRARPKDPQRRPKCAAAAQRAAGGRGPHTRQTLGPAHPSRRTRTNLTPQNWQLWGGVPRCTAAPASERHPRPRHPIRQAKLGTRERATVGRALSTHRQPRCVGRDLHQP